MSESIIPPFYFKAIAVTFKCSFKTDLCSLLQDCYVYNNDDDNLNILR